MNTAEIADAIGITERRVQQLEAVGVLVRDPDRGFDREENGRRYGIYSRRDFDAAARELQDAADRLEQGLDRLAAVDAAKKSAAILATGPAVGRFDAAMRLVNAMMPSGQRALLDHYAATQTGAAIGEFLAGAGLQLNERRAERPPRTRRKA